MSKSQEKYTDIFCLNGTRVAIFLPKIIFRIKIGTYFKRGSTFCTRTVHVQHVAMYVTDANELKMYLRTYALTTIFYPYRLLECNLTYVREYVSISEDWIG